MPSIEMGRRTIEILFQEINIDNVFLGLNVTSQLFAYLEMVLGSLFRSCPALSGKSTTIYKQVSSTNNRTEHPMCLAMSFKK